jgi:uncharacterized membrane protein
MYYYRKDRKKEEEMDIEWIAIALAVLGVIAVVSWLAFLG